MIPCKNCICVAICRHKPYGQLYKDCILLVNYFDNAIEKSWDDIHDQTELINITNRTMRSLIQQELNPSNWKVVDGLIIGYGAEVIC